MVTNRPLDVAEIQQNTVKLQQKSGRSFSHPNPGPGKCVFPQWGNAAKKLVSPNLANIFVDTSSRAAGGIFFHARAIASALRSYASFGSLRAVWRVLLYFPTLQDIEAYNNIDGGTVVGKSDFPAAGAVARLRAGSAAGGPGSARLPPPFPGPL